MIFDDLSLVNVEFADVAGATAIANDMNNSLFFAIVSSAEGLATNITLEHSDDNDNFEDVSAEQTIGSANFLKAEQNVVKKIGYAGGKKYVRLKASVAADNFRAVAIKGRNRHI